MFTPKNNLQLLVVFLGLYFLFCLGAVFTQAVRVEQKPLQHEVTVILKLVQVFVTDKNGNTVPDLNKEDFILFDDGQEKTITDFERHFQVAPEERKTVEITGTKTLPARIVPLQFNRKFFLLLDYYRNDAIGIKKSKEAALHFIDTQLQPTDEVAVLSFSPWYGLIVHEYLTSDHRRASKSIESIKDVPGGSGYQGSGLAVTLQRREEAEAEEETESVWESPPMPIRGLAPIEPQDFAMIMSEMAKALRYIQGYKNVIFFSAGLSRSVLVNPLDQVFGELYQKMSQDLADSNSPVYTVNAVGNRSHFRSMNSRGEYALKMLSSVSGGKYFEDVEDYESISKDIESLTNNYYVLGYYINERWDGKYHEVDVRVKREGCIVHAQKGYYNPRPFTELSDFERQLHLIDLAMSKKSQYQESLTFPMAALPCSDSPRDNCLLISEIITEEMTDVVQQDAEVVALIIDGNNSIVQSSRSEVNFTTIPQKRIYHYFTASLSPGSYQCRVVIRNLTTGRGAVASSSVVIPEKFDSGVRLYPPLLLIPERKVSYLKFSPKKRVETEAEPPSLKAIYHFISTNLSPLIGSLERGVSTILAVLPCHVAGVNKPEVVLSVNLVHSSSGAKTPLTHSILAVEHRETMDLLLLELDLSGFVPGDYQLEFRDEKSTGLVTQSLTIRGN